jgi:hypothetical protein
LQDLREAPRHIKEVFHPHHVLNSDRLKTGAQRAERELEREKKEKKKIKYLLIIYQQEYPTGSS